MRMLDSIILYRISCPQCGTLRLVGSLPLTPLSYCPVCRALRPWDHDLALPQPQVPAPKDGSEPRRWVRNKPLAPKSGGPRAP